MKKLTLLIAGLLLSGMLSVVKAEDAKPMGDAAKPAATSTDAKPMKKTAKKRPMKMKKAKTAPATPATPAIPAAPATAK